LQILTKKDFIMFSSKGEVVQLNNILKRESSNITPFVFKDKPSTLFKHLVFYAFRIDF